MKESYLKRLLIYELVATTLLLVSFFFFILNEDFFNHIIPKDIAGYLFWISLGIYLGFKLCKYELKRVWKKMKEDELQPKKMSKDHRAN
jgi:hypothetical protein